MPSIHRNKLTGLRLIIGGLLLTSVAPLTVVTLSISNVASAATPPKPPGCPEGWIPAPNPRLGCVPNRVQVKPKREITNSTQSNQVKFPPERPKDFTYNKCELGIVDPVDCPENNPISPSRD